MHDAPQVLGLRLGLLEIEGLLRAHELERPRLVGATAHAEQVLLARDEQARGPGAEQRLDGGVGVVFRNGE